MRRILALAAMAAVSVASTAAMANIDLKLFDDGDGQLDKKELAAFRRAVAATAESEERRALLQLIDAAPVDHDGKPVPVDYFGDPADTRTCTKDTGGLVLRRTVLNTSLTGCTAISPDGEVKDPLKVGTTFSFTRDYNADRDELVLKGAIGYVFPGPSPDTPNASGASLADWGLIAFAEADGSLKSDDEDEGTIQFGLKSETAYQGKIIAKTIVGVSGYFLTDFDLKARAYGVQLDVTPASASHYLNGSNLSPDGNATFFVARPVLDILRVEDAGITGLISEESYYWAGGDFGVVIDRPKTFGHGLKFEAGLRAFEDLGSSRSAVLTYADLNLFLNEKRTVALSISYLKGEKRTDLEDKETLEVGIAIAF